MITKAATFLNRTFKSTFLLLVAILVVADLVLSVYVPNRFCEWYQKSISASNEPFCRKIFEYICSNREQQVVLMGSSLPAAASLSCDQVYARGKQPFLRLPNMFTFSQYHRSDFFKQLLSQKFQRKIDVVNLGIAGAVGSDNLWIMEKCLQYRKKPSLIICTVAPAEFLWNDDRAVDKTRIKTSFESFAWPSTKTTVELACNSSAREFIWHYDLLRKELSACKIGVSDFLSEKWQGHRPLLSRGHTTVANGQPDKTSNSSQTDKPVLPGAYDRWGRRNNLEDIPAFRLHYNNLDTALFQKHLANFDNMLALCQNNNIPIVVVNMPLTGENKDSLPKPIYDKFYASISAMSHAHRIPFIDMDTPNTFVTSDFFDSAHLNEVGGRKFFVSLADRISEQPHPEISALPQNTY